VVEDNGEQEAIQKSIDEEVAKMNDPHRDYHIEIAGRYLPGYRIYENYHAYSAKYPHRTVEDYIHDIRREATFEDYRNAYKVACKFFFRIDPTMRAKVIEVTRNHPEKLDGILNSPEFENRIKKEYHNRVRQFNKHSQMYQFAHIMEEFTDSSHHYNTMPKNHKFNKDNGYHSNMLPFHKFSSQLDKPVPLGSMKIGPNDYLTPFKTTPETELQKQYENPQDMAEYRKKSRKLVSFFDYL
jgi:hypothetical protein